MDGIVGPATLGALGRSNASAPSTGNSGSAVNTARAMAGTRYAWGGASPSGFDCSYLVFFNANGPGASHVGIATSNSTVISATTRGVMEHSIGGSYWGSHYIGARRV